MLILLNIVQYYLDHLFHRILESIKTKNLFHFTMKVNFILKTHLYLIKVFQITITKSKFNRLFFNLV